VRYGIAEGISSISSCVTSAQQQQHTEAAAAAASISSNNSSLPNCPRQLLGSYKALMNLLNCNRDRPAIDATTSTVSSASVAIVASVASATASASTSADATPYLHVFPKLADSLA